MDKICQITQETAANLLSRLGQDVELKVTSQNSTINVDVTPENIGLLIGRRGEGLAAFQYILRILVKKNLQSLGDQKLPPIIVNVGDWRLRQKQALEVLAKSAASRVRRTGRPEVLRPMTSYERRIVHLALSEEEGLISESMGEGEERRIVVKKAEK